MRSTPAVQRDDGVRRVSALTRWVAGGSGAAAGMFALVAAHPKVSALRLTHPAVGPATTNGGAGSSAGHQRTSSGGGLTQPTQALTRTTAPAQVVSGGS